MSVNSDHFDERKFDYSDYADSYISLINEETHYYSHKVQLFDDESKEINQEQTQHIKNRIISASQHSLPPLNETKIKRCLSSPSFISYLHGKATKKAMISKQCTNNTMKQLPDLLELYKNIPSFRLNIENLCRKTKSPIMSSDCYILCHHKSNCFRNAIMLGFFRTFAASFVLKTSLLILQNILFGKKKDSFHKISDILTNADSLFFAQFMGLMSFTYKAILCLLRRYFKKDDIKYHSIAGFVSGFWIILDRNHRRQQAYAMNGVIRATYDAIQLCVFYGKLPTITGFNMACFTLTQVILINAAFWRPNYVHPTLYKFLLKVGNMNNDKIQILRDGILSNKFVECCPSLHREKSCLIYNIKDFILSFKRSFLIFVAVHFLPSLLFEPKKVFLNLNKYLKQSFTNTVVSCLFAASYNCTVKGTVCLFRNIFKRDYWWSAIFCALFASLTVLIENVRRRPELTLYCLTRSSEIIMRLFTQNKWPKLYTFLRSKYLRVISFQMCLSLWLTIRQIPKGVEKSNSLNMTVLRMIFGSNN